MAVRNLIQFAELNGLMGMLLTNIIPKLGLAQQYHTVQNRPL